jgi:hypothetical protein
LAAGLVAAGFAAAGLAAAGFVDGGFVDGAAITTAVNVAPTHKIPMRNRVCIQTSFSGDVVRASIRMSDCIVGLASADESSWTDQQNFHQPRAIRAAL